MTCDSSCRGSSGLAGSILTSLGREVRMSLRDRNHGGLVPGEGTLQLFTANEALSDEYRLFLTGSMVNGS